MDALPVGSSPNPGSSEMAAIKVVALLLRSAANGGKEKLVQIADNSAVHGVKEIQIRFHQCIAGAAARSCRVINLCDSADIASMHNPLIDGVPSKGAKRVVGGIAGAAMPTTVMAVPVFGSRGAEGGVVAVLQCMNKIQLPPLEHTLDSAGEPIPHANAALESWKV